MKKEIKFLTPIDSTVLPFNLTINLAKVLNVFHLKQKLSRTFYTPIEFINIVYDRNLLDDDSTSLSSLDLDKRYAFFADIRYPPRIKPPTDFLPFVVGGLDLTDISELQPEFKKKPNPLEDRQDELDLPVQTGGMKPKIQKQIKRQINKDQYSEQLTFMKDMGFIDEEKCVTILDAVNGDLSQAIELIQQQQL